VHRRRSRWQERRWPPTPTCALSQPPEKKKIKLSCQPGKGKKSLRAFRLVPDSGLQCHTPPPHPCSACRAALGPPTFTLFGKVGSRIAPCPLLWQEFLPFHCGTHNTRGRDTAAAATPLRGAHQPSPQLAPKEAVREDQSSLGRRRGHHETRREALPRQWRSDAGQWRTMSSPQDVGGVVVSEEQRGGARVRGVMAKFGRGINHPNVRNLPNIQRSGNRGTPMVPGSLPGHATGSQMVQLGSSRRVTLYSASITASARPPAPPGQWWRSCGWA